jgi:uncharacterized membrane protein YbhN (UPF0104 family)
MILVIGPDNLQVASRCDRKDIGPTTAEHLTNRRVWLRSLVWALRLFGLAVFPVVFLLVIDASAAFRLITSADPLYVALGFAAMLAGIALRAFRWRFVAGACGVASAPYLHYLRLYYAGAFIGAVVPALVGALTPVLFAYRDGNSARRVTASILIDRVVELLLIAVLAGIAFVYLAPSLPNAGFWLLALGGCLLAAVLAAFLGRRWLAALFDMTQTNLSDGLNAVEGTSWRSLLPQIVGLAFLIVGLQVLAALVSAEALHLDVDWLRLSAAYLIIVALTSLPVSLLGFGPREGLLILLLGGSDLASEEAFALGFLLSLLALAARMPGGIAWMLSFRASPPHRVESEGSPVAGP